MRIKQVDNFCNSVPHLDSVFIDAYSFMQIDVPFSSNIKGGRRTQQLHNSLQITNREPF